MNGLYVCSQVSHFEYVDLYHAGVWLSVGIVANIWNNADI